MDCPIIRIFWWRLIYIYLFFIYLDRVKDVLLCLNPDTKYTFRMHVPDKFTLNYSWFLILSFYRLFLIPDNTEFVWIVPDSWYWVSLDCSWLLMLILFRLFLISYAEFVKIVPDSWYWVCLDCSWFLILSLFRLFLIPDTEFV